MRRYKKKSNWLQVSKGSALTITLQFAKSVTSEGATEGCTSLCELEKAAVAFQLKRPSSASACADISEMPQHFQLASFPTVFYHDFLSLSIICEPAFVHFLSQPRITTQVISILASSSPLLSFNLQFIHDVCSNRF